MAVYNHGILIQHVQMRLLAVHEVFAEFDKKLFILLLKVHCVSSPVIYSRKSIISFKSMFFIHQ